MTEKFVWIIRYYGEYEITVCASKEAAYKYGKEFLEDEMSYCKKNDPDAYNAAVKEFEESFAEYDGQFEVEDVFYCDKERIWE